eukprot:TRINITY_DN20393_c0_g1_i1.p1 TRINITY_DN20393_c0_g1~~TRINITY_DN20393_c0_g1_i1.p1  ORF type:complete len:622 (+),score=105.41 TRINITY_DN20393_c0_g1_i1:254-1867(+)
MYAHESGMVGAMMRMSPFGLPAKYQTLPQTLKDLGYHTAAVGKWHLGYSKSEFLPTNRGFDSFAGTLNGGCDYWTKSLCHPPDACFDLSNYTAAGGLQNLIRDTTTHYTRWIGNQAVSIIKNHAAEKPTQPLFLYVAPIAPHSPLEPESHHLANCEHLKHTWRKKYCALMVGVDEMVGGLVQSLREAEMWEDTLFVFSSDNGGMPWAGGFNMPFRGTKISLFEGGVRVPAFVLGPPDVLGPQHYVFRGLGHLADFYPTIVDAVLTRAAEAGSPMQRPELQCSGFSLLPALRDKLDSPRTEAILQVDTEFGGGPNQTHMAIRSGQWKLIIGNPIDDFLYQEPDNDSIWFVRGGSWLEKANELLYWLLEAIYYPIDIIVTKELVRNLRLQIKSRVFEPSFASTKFRLFDLSADPTESNNVAASYPDIVAELTAKLEQSLRTAPKQVDWLAQDLSATMLVAEGVSPTSLFYGPWLADDVDPFSVKTHNRYDLFVGKLQKLIPAVILGVLAILGVVFRCCCGAGKTRSKSLQETPKKKKQL